MELQDLFADYGKVKDLKIISDHRTGYSKGYAVLQYAHLDEARRAVEVLDDTEFMEQKIRVCFCFKAA